MYIEWLHVEFYLIINMYIFYFQYKIILNNCDYEGEGGLGDPLPEFIFSNCHIKWFNIKQY